MGEKQGQIRGLWQYSSILENKFENSLGGGFGHLLGSSAHAKSHPLLEKHRLPTCLGFQNLIAKPSPSGFSKRVFRFYNHWLNPNFSTVFKNVWSRQINYPEQNTAVAGTLQFDLEVFLHAHTSPFVVTFLFCFVFQQAQCSLDLRHITVVELVGVFPTLIGRIGAKIMPPALALQLR